MQDSLFVTDKLVNVFSQKGKLEDLLFNPIFEILSIEPRPFFSSDCVASSVASLHIEASIPFCIVLSSTRLILLSLTEEHFRAI